MKKILVLASLLTLALPFSALALSPADCTGSTQYNSTTDHCDPRGGGNLMYMYPHISPNMPIVAETVGSKTVIHFLGSGIGQFAYGGVYASKVSVPFAVDAYSRPMTQFPTVARKYFGYTTKIRSAELASYHSVDVSGLHGDYYVRPYIVGGDGVHTPAFSAVSGTEVLVHLP